MGIKKIRVNWEDVLLLIVFITISLMIYVLASSVDKVLADQLNDPQKYDRLDAIQVIDVHGDTIIIDENGKYTRLLKKK